jgi:hypothetical protein
MVGRLLDSLGLMAAVGALYVLAVATVVIR